MLSITSLETYLLVCSYLPLLKNYKSLSSRVAANWKENAKFVALRHASLGAMHKICLTDCIYVEPFIWNNKIL